MSLYWSRVLFLHINKPFPVRIKPQYDSHVSIILCIVIFTKYSGGILALQLPLTATCSCPLAALHTLGNSTHIALAPAARPPVVGGDVFQGLLAITQSSPV